MKKISYLILAVLMTACSNKEQIENNLSPEQNDSIRITDSINHIKDSLHNALVYTLPDTNNCDLFYKIRKDDYEKTTNFETKPINILGDDSKMLSFIFSFSPNGEIGWFRGLSFTAYNYNEKCFDKRCEMIFLFDDGTTYTKYNYQDFNCDGNVYLVLDKDDVIGLTKKLIKSTRITGYKYFVETNWGKNEAIGFQKSLRCLTSVEKEFK